MYTVHLDERSIEEILTDPNGPVGDILAELASEMTVTARNIAPVQTPDKWSWSAAKSTSYLPHGGGFTKEFTWYDPPQNDSRGRLFAGTNAPYGPTIWLEHGREGKRPMEPEPFLTTALYSAHL